MPSPWVRSSVRAAGPWLSSWSPWLGLIGANLLFGLVHFVTHSLGGILAGALQFDGNNRIAYVAAGNPIFLNAIVSNLAETCRASEIPYWMGPAVAKRHISVPLAASVARTRPSSPAMNFSSLARRNMPTEIHLVYSTT